jgi:hypothetical protein
MTFWLSQTRASCKLRDAQGVLRCSVRLISLESDFQIRLQARDCDTMIKDSWSADVDDGGSRAVIANRNTHR